MPCTVVYNKLSFFSQHPRSVPSTHILFYIPESLRWPLRLRVVMVTLKLNQSFHNPIVCPIILLSYNVLMVLGKEPEEGEIHEMTIRPSEMASDATPASAVSTQSVVSQAIGAASTSALAFQV